MLFPPSLDLTRGVGFYGNSRRWPNHIIPYDISAITSRFLETKKDFVMVYL
jgi:hypothetical protein